MPRMPIERLYVLTEVAHLPAVHRIEARLGLRAVAVEGMAAVYARINTAPDPVGAGKRILVLSRNRGRFVRDCPGTRTYTCCGYRILHVGTFCTMDCAYCILQAYFHPPVLQYFVNVDRRDAELAEVFRQPRISRIGTGEYTDSLIWERWTDLSTALVPQFAAQSRAVLELKSKCVDVSNLAALTHRRKTIMAWSLNTPHLIATAERGTASLDSRLAAAARCAAWGYPLAFHFDPMVLHDGCEEAYRDVVHRLVSRVDPAAIVWISLGTFRFMPDLKAVIQRRFPGSPIVYGEFVPGLDAKMRYFKPLRRMLYNKMAAWLREAAPGVTLYFCMEDDEVWQDALGFTPAQRGGLGRILDDSARRVCGLRPDG